MAGSPADLLERFGGLPEVLAGPVRSAGAPHGNEWSAQQVVRHLLAVEVLVWQARLDSLDGPSEPHWSWAEPGLADRPPDETPDATVAAFRVSRGATMARLTAFDEPGWARTGLHDTFGRLDVEGLLRIALDHDREHLAQIAELGPSRTGARP